MLLAFVTCENLLSTPAHSSLTRGVAAPPPPAV